MLGDKMKVIEVQEGTTEELLNGDISREQRFIVGLVDYVLKSFGDYLLENKIKPNAYIDTVFRIISNISINTLVPFVRCVAKENQDYSMQDAIKIISEMIYSGWQAHEECEKHDKGSMH